MLITSSKLLMRNYSPYAIKHLRAEPHPLTKEIPLVVERFQKKQATWMTENCQHYKQDGIHYYGIHKDRQMQVGATVKEAIIKTRTLYQTMKSHVLWSNGLSPDTKVVQVIGDSSAFSPEGTERVKEFLRDELSDNVVILYGYTGHAESDGTRCVNACVSDVIMEKELQNQTVGNLVAFHSVQAIKEWGCSGPPLNNYVIVYGDDESCKEKGSVFGKDVTTSDFFSDRFLVCDGGAQSLRQMCNALLLGLEMKIISGLRGDDMQFCVEHECGITVYTPYLSAAKFLENLADFVNQKRGEPAELELQDWYKSYFGKGKCYVGNPTKPDFFTKKELLNSAWQLIIEHQLYKNLPGLNQEIRSKL